MVKESTVFNSHTDTAPPHEKVHIPQAPPSNFGIIYNRIICTMIGLGIVCTMIGLGMIHNRVICTMIGLGMNHNRVICTIIRSPSGPTNQERTGRLGDEAQARDKKELGLPNPKP